MLLTPNSCFVHVPKTGGTWVRAAIQVSGIPHLAVGGHHDTLNDEKRLVMHDRLTFAFARHPVSWWASFWAYSIEHGWPPVSGPLWDRITRNCVMPTFGEFMDRMLAEHPGAYTHILFRYLEHVDFIGRYEHLEHDLVAAMERAGEHHTLVLPARLNASKPPEVPEPLRRKILETEKDTVSRFYGDTP
jgi:hypothetical protein